MFFGEAQALIDFTLQKSDAHVRTAATVIRAYGPFRHSR
jgi:hypothetical protein